MDGVQLRLGQTRPHWAAAETRGQEVARAIAAESIRPGALEDRFREYHAKHPAVYAELVARARAIKARGFRHYSIDTIFSALRYDSDLARGRERDGFVLNNNHRAYYARLIHEQEADLRGFFELRQLGRDRVPAAKRVRP